MISTMTKSKLRRKRFISAWNSQGYTPSRRKSGQELEGGTEAEGIKYCFLASIPCHAHCFLMQPRTTCPARDGAAPMWSGPTYGNHQKCILQIQLQATQWGHFLNWSSPNNSRLCQVEKQQQQNSPNKKPTSTKTEVIKKHLCLLLSILRWVNIVIRFIWGRGLKQAILLMHPVFRRVQ